MSVDSAYQLGVVVDLVWDLSGLHPDERVLLVRDVMVVVLDLFLGTLFLRSFPGAGGLALLGFVHEEGDRLDRGLRRRHS